MRAEFTRRCHVVEEAYEFMLAYAARGVDGAGDGQSAPVREHLRRAVEALTGIGELLTALVEAERLPSPERYEAFRRVLDRDADAALAAIRLVELQPAISSQMVDNLNASIHVRALLTDLFVIDEVLSPQAVAPSSIPQQG